MARSNVAKIADHLQDVNNAKPAEQGIIETPVVETPRLSPVSVANAADSALLAAEQVKLYLASLSGAVDALRAEHATVKATFEAARAVWEAEDKRLQVAILEADKPLAAIRAAMGIPVAAAPVARVTGAPRVCSVCNVQGHNARNPTFHPAAVATEPALPEGRGGSGLAEN